eukprot:scaffold58456_cov30-Phaeocystis_antarctica.AAC.1
MKFSTGITIHDFEGLRSPRAHLDTVLRNLLSHPRHPLTKGLYSYSTQSIRAAPCTSGRVDCQAPGRSGASEARLVCEGRAGEQVRLGALHVFVQRVPELHDRHAHLVRLRVLLGEVHLLDVERLDELVELLVVVLQVVASHFGEELGRVLVRPPLELPGVARCEDGHEAVPIHRGIAAAACLERVVRHEEGAP